MKNTRLRFFAIMMVSIFTIQAGFAQYFETTVNSKIKAEFPWPKGKKMALSLSFDDARQSQVKNGMPLLNRYGVKATFYVLKDSVMLQRDGWRDAVKKGHDIGNHTLKHACSGNFEFSRANALEELTLAQLNKEIDQATAFLNTEIGAKPVSFAYPCGQKFVGRGKDLKSYVPLIAEKFETGRGWMDEDANDPIYCDLAQLTGMEMDMKSFAQIKKLIDYAKLKGRWLVLAGHEINKGGSQTTALATLEAILKYAADPANGVWLDDVHNVASYVNKTRMEIKKVKKAL